MAVFDEGGVAAAGAYLRRGLLIPDDAGTVAHVYFNGAGLVDRFGNAWTQNGTVPQVARSGRTPPGAGPFSDANYYSLGTGSDVLDFAGDFSACFIFGAASFAATPMIFSNGLYQTGGYFAQAIATSWACGSGVAAQPSATTANAPTTSAVNVGCIGRSGTTIYAKLNLGTIASVNLGSVATPATTRAAMIGRYTNVGLSNPGQEYELWFSTTTPTDALFTAIGARVKARLGIVQW